MKKIATFVLALMLTCSIFSVNVSSINTEDIPTVMDFSLTPNIETVYENNDIRASGLILSYGLELKKSGTTLTIIGLTDCSTEVVKCGFKNLVVQRRKNSTASWEDYYEYGDLYIESTSARLSTTLSVASGYQYRLSCKHYAKKSLLVTQKIANTSGIVTVS